MKSSTDLPKKKKTLNKNISKAFKEDTKMKFTTKAIKSKENGKLFSIENNKKIKSIERQKNAEDTDTAVTVGKEQEGLLKKGRKTGKKKIIEIRDESTKENMQISNQISEKEKQKVVKVQNTNKADLKRKSFSNMKNVKKLKPDMDISTTHELGTNIKSISKKKTQKKVVESKEKEDDINSRDLSKKHILQCISAIFHLTQEQLKNKNDLFSGEPEPIFMQVTCIRVPKVPRRQIRMVLPHSIVSAADDIALFVCDLARGRRKDYEPTVDHYRELLDKCGCTRIKDIIPMNQVKTEYDQYELKRKLVASYDHFLVDGRIAGHMSHLLGKIFDKKRKFATSIKMDSKDLKHQIDYALQKTVMRSHSFGDCHTIQVANTSMKKRYILENIIALCNNLAKVYPGGWSNIRAIRLKTRTGPSLLIYLTLKNKNTVKTPVVKPKRPKAYCNVEGELTTLSGNANVIVTPEGDVTVKQIFSEESEVSEDDNESVEKE